MPKSATSETALSVEVLSGLIDYNPETGALTWKVTRNAYGGQVKPGTPAGRVDKHGYLLLVINGLVYWGHRLAWYLHYGVWPQNQIDHVNMDPLDNRVANLREATMTQQRANQRVRRDSKSGVKGVQQTKSGRWRARIASRDIGHFDTPQEAHSAYVAAAKREFGEFARSQ